MRLFPRCHISVIDYGCEYPTKCLRLLEIVAKFVAKKSMVIYPLKLRVIRISGRPQGKKMTLDQWSASDVRKLEELGYQWVGDEWEKGNPGRLYEEFKRVEKLIKETHVNFGFSCKRIDWKILI